MMRMVQHPTQVNLMHTGPVFSVERLHFETEAGTIHRDVVRHPGAVTVIGERDDGRLVMIRNHRVAVGEALLEFCAGKLEPGEEPSRAAARELEEETGCSAASLEPLGLFYTSPGFADERMHVYHATDLTTVPRRLEPGESIEVVLMEPEAVHKAIESGELKDGKSIAAFHLWDRARTRDGGRS